MLQREAKWNGQPVTEINSRDCNPNDFASYSGFWKSYKDRAYVGQNECETDDSNKCCNYWELGLGKLIFILKPNLEPKHQKIYKMAGLKFFLP